MNLEQIVPPLEDCQLIPEGSFKDSVLVWKDTLIERYSQESPTIFNLFELSHRTTSLNGCYFPAPTLAEIMAEIPGCNCEYYNGVFTVEIGIFHASMKFVDKNPATAALRLWLKINTQK